MNWHEPVLRGEVLSFLNLLSAKKATIVDATVGDGGHAAAILEKFPQAQVIGIDEDPIMLQRARVRLEPYGDRLKLKAGNFAEVLPSLNQPVQAVLLDLGLASFHFDEAGRGFSFQRDEPLDMRLDPKTRLTAAQIVNNWPAPAIEKILRAFGEERFAARFARAIKAHKGRINTTGQLISIIRRASPRRSRRHPATRVFQALRIAVNDELNSLARGLRAALECLEGGGLMLAISFHSLEDRLVKDYFRGQAQAGRVLVLTKKPVRPSLQEVRLNPRSRTAKLRAATKLT